MTDSGRASQISAIHAKAQKAFGPGYRDESSGYRDMIRTVGRAQSGSAADLDFDGRMRVLDYLKHLVEKRPTPAEPVARMSAKIRVLLRSADRPDAYADRIAQRMFRVHFWEWLRPDQMRSLVTALQIDENRRAKGGSSGQRRARPTAVAQIATRRS